MAASIVVGERRIGAGAPCYVVAEVGVNHDGDVAVAHELVEVAARAGADAVKFQTFDPAQLVSTEAATAPYQVETTGHTTQRAMLERLCLPDSAWGELADHAREQGLDFLSTAFDAPSAALLAQLGVPALKVPSGELTNLPFIRSLAAYGLPLLVSTGMADLGEVEAAVEAAGTAPGIVLLHCVSAYPADDHDANLRAIETMRHRFGLPVGWSDHTIGSLTAVVAVALGATLLEKHVTLDRSRPGPDHAASVDPHGLVDYVAHVRRVEATLGDGEKVPRSSELDNRRVARRSWHATRDLPAGHRVQADDLVALRPASGVAPSADLVGVRLRREVRAGEPIHEADVEPDADDPASSGGVRTSGPS